MSKVTKKSVVSKSSNSKKEKRGNNAKKESNTTEKNKPANATVSAKKSSVRKKKAIAKKKTAQRDNTLDLGINSKSELLHVNPKKLKISWEENPRNDYGDMSTLKASIIMRGVENPVRVKKTKEGLQLVAGYRRTKACLEIIKDGGIIKDIPAILEKANTTGKETLIHVFVENDGKPFNPIEEAFLFQRMKVEHGMNGAEIAESIGRTVVTVSQRLSLLKASLMMRQALQEGTINVSTALQIIKAHRKDPDAQDNLLADLTNALAVGDKKAIKEAKVKVAKSTGTSNSKGIPHKEAKDILNEIATQYIAFVRGQDLANSKNAAWVNLLGSLENIRALKREGKFK